MSEPLRGNDENVLDFALKPTASVVHVTPDIAKRWLGRNHVNRNVRNSKVDAYVRDMQAGAWQITGEAIKFAADGSLLDGQHRLNAVVKSGCTVPMFVVRGLSPAAQTVMDTGSARTAADALGLGGHKNSVALAAITRLLLIGETGKQPSHAEIIARVEEDSEALAIVSSIAVRHARGCDLAPSLVGHSAWLIGSAGYMTEAENFWELADEKVGLHQGDPILAMLKCFAECRRSGRKLDHQAQLSVIIRAYNHRRRGHQLKLMKVHSPNGGVIPVPEVAR